MHGGGGGLAKLVKSQLLKNFFKPFPKSNLIGLDMCVETPGVILSMACFDLRLLLHISNTWKVYGQRKKRSQKMKICDLMFRLKPFPGPKTELKQT